MSTNERPSRWGASNKRAREEDEEEYRPMREKRGYEIHDGNMRRRDDYGTHPHDGYYGRGYSEEQPRYSDEPEWKCTECGIRNYDTDELCGRCGTPFGKQKRSESQDDSLDEFGRKRGPVRESRTKWPKPFESDGAAYVFDVRSGMFYEAMADFFYDPKTKLYYGNKQKKYYSYHPGEDPPFCELAAFAGEEVSSAGDVTVVSDSTGPKPEEKKKIAISLKTTILPGEGSAAKNSKGTKKAKSTTTPNPSRVQKQHTVNIEKWSERVKEIREVPAIDSSTKDLPKTNKGQPVCLLCRRKFSSVEKLRQHEALSTLHKENLEKKNADETKKEELEASLEYRDRALERRIMHGPETSSLPALPRDLEAAGAAGRETDIVRPEDNLGTSNIGNQMLQKLGWKSGASLGRNASGDMPNTDGSAAVQISLVKDWEKIETIAAAGHYPRMKPNARGGGIGS